MGKQKPDDSASWCPFCFIHSKCGKSAAAQHLRATYRELLLAARALADAGLKRLEPEKKPRAARKVKVK